jgi:hypothetical protein
MTKILTIEKQEALQQYEAVIEKGLQTFYEVGQALAFIREKKLYRAEYKTFEDYCRERWGIQRNYANKLIAASEVVQNIGMGTIVPNSESQARPLSTLDPETQREAWDELVKQSEDTGEPITAKKVSAIVEYFKTEGTRNKEDLNQHRLEKLGKKISGEPIPDDQQLRIADLEQGKTVVLNINKDQHLLKYAIEKGLYVRCDGVSEWGNPIVANVDGTYEEVCTLYEKMYLPYKKELLSRLHELKGKALGAHCYPERCHCEVLREWVETGG